MRKYPFSSNNMVRDIFENIVICKHCNVEMKKIEIVRNGFVLRALKCERCKDIIIHPKDEEEYKKFMNLKKKEFYVKMRFVGNSYAISIPKEIIRFMQGQERLMNEMVKLYFEDFGRISLIFNCYAKLNRDKMKDGEGEINKVKSG